MKLNRVTCAAALLVLGFGISGLSQEAAEADNGRDHITPNGVLGIGVGATDVWSLQCGIGSSRARADVLDLGGIDGIRFNVVLTDGHGGSIGATSADGGLSPSLTLTRGAGNYLVIVSKTIAGTVEVYNSLVHCETSTGAAAPHNIIQVQNQ